jgi:ribosome-associated heat shock protein Hsp15
MAAQRIDKWLWAARFYKTRALAAEEIGKGRVQVNGVWAKPSREVRRGDTVCLRIGSVQWTVEVQGLSPQRGPAPVARQLYRETPASETARAHAAEMNRLARDPAQAMPDGRPTKRERRQLEHHWNERWSASLD